VLDCK
jgi:hypothetical protein